MNRRKIFNPHPHDRVELRHNRFDSRGLKEQAQMERLSRSKISIGTFTILPPKPHTEIKSFTLALSQPVPKHELYAKIHETFNGHWDGEPTKSVIVHLSKPIELQELRRKLKEKFVSVLLPE